LRKAKLSRRRKQVARLDWGWLTMFNSIRNYAEREGSRLLAGLFFACAISYDARQLRDFTDPAAVFFTFKLDRQHGFADLRNLKA